MTKQLFAPILFLLLSTHSFAQKVFTISGIVSEQASEETLIGVNIIFPELSKGTNTNGYGFYSITLRRRHLHHRN